MRAAALLVLLGLALASAAAPQEPRVQSVGDADPMLAVARERYGSEAWPKGERRAGFDLGALAVEGYVGGALEPVGDLVSRRFRAKLEGGRGFHVELFVAEEVAGAQEALVSWLAGASSIDPVPRAAELGIAVGEVAYAGRSPHGPEHPHWVGFVRGNVAVRLVATDLRAEPRPSLAAIARQLDAALRAVRALEPAEPLPRPEIARFELERPRLVAGESMRVELVLVDPLGGEVEPHFVLGGPATGYVERGADGELRLFTTGAGAMELRLEALGSNGAFARRALPLTVDPRR